MKRLTYSRYTLWDPLNNQTRELVSQKLLSVDSLVIQELTPLPPLMISCSLILFASLFYLYNLQIQRLTGRLKDGVKSLSNGPQLSCPGISLLSVVQVTVKEILIGNSLLLGIKERREKRGLLGHLQKRSSLGTAKKKRFLPYLLSWDMIRRRLET